MSHCLFCGARAGAILKPAQRTPHAVRILQRSLAAGNGARAWENDHRLLSGPAPPLPTDSEEVLFYRWPTMRHFRLISKIKIYQVSLMFALVPPALYWYGVDEITTGALMGGGVALTGTSAILGILSYYFSRVAGEMRYNPRSDTLRISTLSFWGNRKESKFPAAGVVNFADSQTRTGGAFQRLEVEGHQTVFLWSLKYGRVLDFELLCKVLKVSKEDFSYF